MTYLLDTNVVSELRRQRPAPTVLDWADSVPYHHTFISVVTVQEIEIGVLRVERRDPKQGAALRRWFENRVLRQYEGRVLGFDLASARATAALQVPDPRPERDAMIAAIAQQSGLTVVTRNVSDFEPMGVNLLNPFDAPDLR